MLSVANEVKMIALAKDDMITTIAMITKENWHHRYVLPGANHVSIDDHNKMITITTIVKRKSFINIYSLLPTRSRLMIRQ